MMVDRIFDNTQSILDLVEHTEMKHDGADYSYEVWLDGQHLTELFFLAGYSF